ncbi:MAG: ribokinase [Cyclobacteriaceae bacterium]|nr:ribokinase [Cyclobacteriaceae bacterium]
MSAPIFVFGSSNTDMVVRTTRIPRPGETILGGDFFMNAGGKGANQAVAAARLGGDVTFVANVGDDMFGRQAIEQFEREKIRTRFITRDSRYPSGVALIVVDTKGENNIVVAPGANQHLTPAHVESVLSHCPPDSILLTQLEIPMETVAALASAARKNGWRLVLNPAPAAELPEEILSGVFAITPNEHETSLITGLKVHDAEEAAVAGAWFLSKGVKQAIITLGSQGALLVNAQDNQRIPTPKVTAVDTTAAGDCFNGAMVAGMAAGLSLHDAAVRACRAAAISVTRLGAQSSMPYLNEVIPA